jgi:hypothetical protein
MTRKHAGCVLATLVAGFPAATLEPESVDLFVDAIAELGDQELALEVATRLTRQLTRFPALADLLGEYHRERGRRARALEQSEASGERDPEVAAAIVNFAAALKARIDGVEPVPLLLADEGPCDDGCGRAGERVHAGALRLCQPCALARQRVAATLEREQLVEAELGHETVAA